MLDEIFRAQKCVDDRPLINKRLTNLSQYRSFSIKRPSNFIQDRPLSTDHPLSEDHPLSGLFTFTTCTLGQPHSPFTLDWPNFTSNLNTRKCETENWCILRRRFSSLDSRRSGIKYAYANWKWTWTFCCQVKIFIQFFLSYVGMSVRRYVFAVGHVTPNHMSGGHLKHH